MAWQVNSNHLKSAAIFVAAAPIRTAFSVMNAGLFCGYYLTIVSASVVSGVVKGAIDTMRGLSPQSSLYQRVVERCNNNFEALSSHYNNYQTAIGLIDVAITVLTGVCLINAAVKIIAKPSRAPAIALWETVRFNAIESLHSSHHEPVQTPANLDSALRRMLIWLLTPYQPVLDVGATIMQRTTQFANYMARNPRLA